MVRVCARGGKHTHVTPGSELELSMRRREDELRDARREASEARAHVQRLMKLVSELESQRHALPSLPPS